LGDEDLCCEVSASDNGEDVERTKSGSEISGSDVECRKPGSEVSGSDDGEEVEREVFGSNSDEDVGVRHAEPESNYSEDVESEGEESTDLEVQRSDSISTNDEIERTDDLGDDLTFIKGTPDEAHKKTDMSAGDEMGVTSGGAFESPSPNQCGPLENMGIGHGEGNVTRDEAFLLPHDPSHHRWIASLSIAAAARLAASSAREHRCRHNDKLVEADDVGSPRPMDSSGSGSELDNTISWDDSASESSINDLISGNEYERNSVPINKDENGLDNEDLDGLAGGYDYRDMGST